MAFGYLTARQVAPREAPTESRARPGTDAHHGLAPLYAGVGSAPHRTRRPDLLEIRASGDFEGRGIWSIVEDGKFTDITFDWKVDVRKLLPRYLSPAFRPAFEANHRWAMEQGRASLELELARGRATTVEQMNSIAAAPGPHRLPMQQVWAGAGLSLVLMAALARGTLKG